MSKKQVKHAIIGIESGDKAFRWIGAVGEADTNGTPMLADTPFFIASVTKLYIAAAILKLLEQGVLRLEDPISAHLPQSLIGGLHNLNGVDHTDKIRVRHLLSHTSGLPDWLADRPKGGKGLLEKLDDEEDRLITIEEVVDFVRNKLIPHFPPQPADKKRQRVRYSDTNFQLLISMIEILTKMPLPQAFEEMLYRPLGLRRTFHPEHSPAEPGTKPATFWVGNKPVSKPLLLRSSRDLYSTADDLLRFMRALVKGEVFQHARTADLMQLRWNRFGFPRDLVALRLPGWPIEYGLGMMRLKLPRIFSPFKRTPAVVGHTGVTGSWLFYCPERDLYLCGTVDQVTASALPFRFVPKLLSIVDSTRK